MSNKISQEDVARLMADPSAENRADTAQKVASQFGRGELSQSESKMAEDIFEIMVRDAEVRVREALAKNLRAAPNLPHDLALKLAGDISDSVALPIIQFSEVLNDEDLIAIVETQSSVRQVAVAERPQVSEAVSDAIVDHGSQDAVVSLVSNNGAEISEQAMVRVVEKHGDVETVQRPLVERAKLPVTVAERLVARISDELKEYLVTHHDLPEEMASDLIMQTRERATVGLVSGGASDDELFELIRQLRINGRLTPSIILRALCLGDMPFFEVSMSELANVPVANARILLHDEGELGFKSIYAKAGMPDVLFQAYRSAVDMNINAEHERTDDDPEIVMRRMLEHILTDHEDLTEEFGVENLDYLLAKFNQIERPGPTAS
ncbi:MAG: DUF2336 domain-containing protein [Alphaproteobacteria bacterium]|nr:DUF2336 domain-containing protein [Alphaproteobacteria bacterium]